MSTDTFGAMTGEEIVELSKRHTLFDWSAQARVDPIPVALARLADVGVGYSQRFCHVYRSGWRTRVEGSADDEERGATATESGRRRSSEQAGGLQPDPGEA